jgi:hypothetical protein
LDWLVERPGSQGKADQIQEMLGIRRSNLGRSRKPCVVQIFLISLQELETWMYNNVGRYRFVLPSSITPALRNWSFHQPFVTSITIYIVLRRYFHDLAFFPGNSQSYLFSHSIPQALQRRAQIVQPHRRPYLASCGSTGVLLLRTSSEPANTVVPACPVAFSSLVSPIADLAACH